MSNNEGKIAASNVSLSSLQSVITGGATTIIDYNLTANKVVVADANGKTSTSSISNIEVGYLAGGNDLIQTQLNSKANQLTTYTKTEVNNSSALKANQATTYKKTEVDNSLALKQNKLLRPAIEGNNGWGAIDAMNTVRRIVGYQPIRTFAIWILLILAVLTKSILD